MGHDVPHTGPWGRLMEFRGIYYLKLFFTNKIGHRNDNTHSYFS